MIDAALQKEMLTALEWYAENGVDEILLDAVQDRTIPLAPAPTLIPVMAFETENQAAHAVAATEAQQAFLGKSDAYDEAVKLAKNANNIDELRHVVQSFDGVAIKKTATNMVFADGNPKAHIMVIGDTPGAEDDREGTPFSGQTGQLLDKILACIDLGRKAEDPKNSVYITNILNWRPPGNRTPSPAEVEVSLPFIERHIQLVQPKFIILCGSIPAKSLLGNTSGLSRLRKTWHDYKPQTQQLASDLPIPAIATYHPSYLLKTPQQKKAVWQDMLMLKKKLQAT